MPFMLLYLNVQVNSNGNLSPGQAVSAYSPQTFPLDDFRLIAVFWADVDTEPDDSGEVWYRTTTSTSLLARAEIDINRAYQSVQDLDHLLIATWNRVGYYSGKTNKVKHGHVDTHEAVGFSCILYRETHFSVYWL